MSVCSLSPTHFPMICPERKCFHANVSPIRRVHSQVSTLKKTYLNTLLTYADMSKYTLAKEVAQWAKLNVAFWLMYT